MNLGQPQRQRERQKTMASGLHDELDWQFIQSFGDDASSDGTPHVPPIPPVTGLLVGQLEDLITAVEFDETGSHLAVGDKAGRICIFESYRSHRKEVGCNPHPLMDVSAS